MWEGSERIAIAAPPAAVWAVVSDVARHQQLAGSGEIKALRVNGPVAKGSAWEADEQVKGVGAFTARSECVTFDSPREFSWKSYPPPVKPGNAQSIPDVTWWFRLSPDGEGTTLEHAYRVVEPKVGGLLMKGFYLATGRAAAIRKGMRQTLANVKAAVEQGPS
jgi:uncharacterized protein YndB with AHSA1/START domain